jgi:hypothetical protein
MHCQYKYYFSIDLLLALLVLLTVNLPPRSKKFVSEYNQPGCLSQSKKRSAAGCYMGEQAGCKPEQLTQSTTRDEASDQPQPHAEKDEETKP